MGEEREKRKRREKRRESREREEREKKETAAADKYKIRQDSTPECVELELRKERRRRRKKESSRWRVQMASRRTISTRTMKFKSVFRVAAAVAIAASVLLLWGFARWPRLNAGGGTNLVPYFSHIKEATEELSIMAESTRRGRLWGV